LRGKGKNRLINEMYFQKIITKSLINIRFRLNKLIDQDAPKPPELTFEQWNDLTAARKTEVAKQKSQKMRAVSKRSKTSKDSQLHGLREAALVRLVRFSSCITPPI